MAGGAACALIEIAREMARQGRSDWKALQDRARELGIEIDEPTARKATSAGGEKYVREKGPISEKINAKKSEQAKNLAAVQDTTGREFLEGVYKAGLLASARPLQASFFGNAISRVLEDVARTPASMIDSVLSLRSKERSVSTAGVLTGQRMQWSQESAKQAVQKLITGASDMELAKQDQHGRLDYRIGGSARSGPMAAIGAVTDPLTRSVSWLANKAFDTVAAADVPARRGEFARALMEQAYLDGMNKGLSGQALKDHANSLLGSEPSPEIVASTIANLPEDHPLREMFSNAMAEVSVSVLENETPLTKATGALSRVPVVGPVVLPFHKIPSNAITRGLEWSPLGTPYSIGKLLHFMWTGDADSQRSASLAMGKQLTGAGLMWAGYLLYGAGLLAPPTSMSKGDRDTEEAAGVVGSSVRLGDRWISVRDVPQFLPLLMGAMWKRSEDLAKVDEHDWDPATGIAKASALAAANSVRDLPTMQGITSLTDSMQQVMADSNDGQFDLVDNVKNSKLVAGLGGSVVPSGVTDLATQGDEYKRGAHTFLEKMQADFTGRGDLPVDRDTLGRPIRKTTGFSTQVRGLSPDVGDKLRDPVAKEVYRLGMAIPKPNRVKPGKRDDADRTQSEYESRIERSGGELYDQMKALIGSDWYKGASDKERKEELEHVRSYARTHSSKGIKLDREGERAK